jgi:hypothetical protein
MFTENSKENKLRQVIRSRPVVADTGITVAKKNSREVYRVKKMLC